MYQVYEDGNSRINRGAARLTNATADGNNDPARIAGSSGAEDGGLLKAGRKALAVVAAIVVVTVALYWPVREFDFLNYDDYEYVTRNAQVSKGLTWDGIAWAMTAAYADNWHPATWISHMLDVEIFGLDPGAHHLVNVGFHVANAVLFFLLLAGTTGAIWQSAAVAVLFAVHPLHVESVAWISERKDVLSTFFLLLTCAVYLWYLRRKNSWRYGLMVLLFTWGLMAKAMLVTLPFALLLLDYWPLRRWERESRYAPAWREGSWLRTLGRLVREKGILIALSLAAAVITFSVQLEGGTVAPLRTFPLSSRLANALTSYAGYLYHMVYPAHLSPTYQFDKEPLVATVLAGVLLCAVSAFVYRRRARQRYLVTGWLWYLLTLVPVIGLVQIGGTSMADRYTYIPLIGVFIMLSWGLGDLTSGWKYRTAALIAIFLAVLPATIVPARKQLGIWRNSQTLAAVMHIGDADDYGIYLDLAEQAVRGGDAEKGATWYRKAILIKPEVTAARNALGDLLLAQGKIGEAEAEYAAALRTEPQSAITHVNLGNIAIRKGELEQALSHFRQVLQRSPELAVVWNNIGVVLTRQGKTQEAIASFQSGLRAEPGNAQIHFNLGEAWLSQGKIGEAAEEYAAAVRLRPDFTEAQRRLGETEKVRGRR